MLHQVPGGLPPLPEVLPSPFASAPPHAQAVAAATALQAALDADETLRAALSAPGGGKMFGVLVLDGGQALWGFSGMLAGAWTHPAFVPPLFEEPQRDRFWIEGQAELAAIEARLHALQRDAEALAEEGRALVRGRAATPARTPTEQRAVRDLERAHTAHRAAIGAARAALHAERHATSRRLWDQIVDGYVVPDARGGRHPLRELFPRRLPPGGAGDCAAPKLLAAAHRLGRRPRLLAEFWWGAPSANGDRRAGVFYPACRGKCWPILPAMLTGLAVEPPPRHGGGPVDADEPRDVFADDRVVVVDKPAGLLSVPGRGGALRDCAETRVRARLESPALTVAHRLDLDTSGLLILARDRETLVALQRAFARREVAKRYVADVAGEVVGEAGVIDLPLAADLSDRPRQVVDRDVGRPAQTAWRVLARGRGRTRVELVPATGRTHQLRVHCAHAEGLATPIVGDRLYGDAVAARLHLHAHALAFDHPRGGARVELASAVPFALDEV